MADNVLKSRLKRLLDDSKKSPRAVSIEATGKPDTVRDILRGKTKSPRGETLSGLARTLSATVGYLTGDSDVRQLPPTKATHGLVPARVIGSVQAGAFMELATFSIDEDDPKWVATVKDEAFPALEPVAFLVVGDSINQKCEPGGYAVCLPFADTGLQIKDGMWVVAERTRGNTVERTVKQVRVHGRKFQLLPASTNPKWTPISFPSAEPHEEVRVIAVVRRFIGPTLPL